MPKTINKLTPEQEARFGEWVDKWTKIGLCTDRADFAAATRGVAGCYKAAKKEMPSAVVAVGNPLVGALAASITARVIEDILGETRKSEGKETATEPIEAMTPDTSLLAPSGAFGEIPRLGGSIQMGVIEGYNTKGMETGIHSEAVLKAVELALAPYIEKPQDRIKKAIESKSKLAWHSWMWGQFYANWHAYISFFREVCELELPPELAEADDAYQLTAKSASFWWPNENFVFICDRPSRIDRNAQGRLHADGKTAIEWPDGWGIHVLNGVRVPAWLAETPGEKLDCKEYTKIQNVEHRREFLRKVGADRLLHVLGSELLDKDDDYELHLLDLGGRTGKWPYLKMLNPSIGVWHIEAVGENCYTVKAALAFRNGTEAEPMKLA